MMVLLGMPVGTLLAPVLPSIPLRVLRAPTAVVLTTSLPSTPVYRTAPEATVRSVDLQVWIGGIYGLVAIALLTRLALGYRAMRRLVGASVAVRGEMIRESAEVAVPMTAGMRRPVILLPLAWREWSAEKLEAVLAHEQAHIYHRDWAVMLIARINRGVFWFHPLAWWLERKLAALAEEACDDAAVTRIGDRVVYAQVLLEIAGGVQTGRMFQEGIAMARMANVESRIDRVLDESRQLSKTLGHAAAALVALIGGPVLYLVWAVQLGPAQATAQAQTQQAKPPATPTRALDGPWQKWLTQEVVYIITDEERAAFMRLTTNAERERFSEQFWARRDPTPGTGANKFQDEHYRRIAYSNERFAADAPGWQSDRGRIYIMYGPPDEIESHPSAGPDRPAREDWLYRHIEGVGDRVILTFTDDDGNRAYRLTKDPRGVTTPKKQRP
jgi:GWxTD domain-containing protein